MAATLGARRMAATALGVGAAAGCMGTWFEMSHGIVCIPVLTLPPFMLSQQVAVGSTVLGVAARQVLSAGLYALEPSNDHSSLEALSELIDVNAAMVLAASGTTAALGSSALVARLALRPVRRANGAFLAAVAIFIYWRENHARHSKSEDDEEGDSGALPANAAPEATWPRAEVSAAALHPATGSISELARHLVLGAASGAVLGFFGIGPAWMLAPMLLQTAPDRLDGLEAVSHAGAVPDAALAAAREERARMTSCVAMVPPSIVAAWRHLTLGHVANARLVALPLATGAILGSIVGGQELADVPCEQEVRNGMSLLLFSFGSWCVFRPR